MQVTFLFWNLMRKPLAGRVAQIAAHYGVDVVLLAECAAPLADFTAALDATGTGKWVIPWSLGPKVHLLTRFDAGVFTEVYSETNGRLSIRRIDLAGTGPSLLAVVHFPSKINYDHDDQTMLAVLMAQNIAKIETRSNLSRTILVGDMNMNPYEPGMIGAQTFNAVMTRDDAQRKNRVVDGETFRYFYNPMWGYFGDQNDGPPGTYFLRSAKPVNSFWHMYDQVLLRPELMNKLGEVRIIDSDGINSLLTRTGRPNKSTASDHLPLLFRLEL